MNKLIISLFVFLSIVSCKNLDAVTLNFYPDIQEVQIGDVASIDLVMSELGEYSAPSIDKFFIDALWNPRILRLNDVIFGDQLDLFETGSIAEYIPVMNGMVTMEEASFSQYDYIHANQLDAFVLATLNFNTIAIGTSLVGSDDEIFGWAGGTPLAIDTIEMGRINVVEATPVPIPTAILLFGSGLAGTFFFCRKDKHEA